MNTESFNHTPIKCNNCGHEIERAEGVKFCPVCGARLEDADGSESIPEPEGTKKSHKRVFVVAAILIVALFGVLFATKVICFHKWQPATCSTPETCSVCGRTRGDALPHTWEDATCTTPKTCSVCGKTEGSSLGHDYSDWKTIKESGWRQEGKYERVCSRCDEKDTKTTEAYLSTVLDMNLQFCKYAEDGTHPDGYEGLRTDNGYIFMVDCGYSSEDLVELSYTNSAGDKFISNTSDTLPDKILFLQMIPDDEWTYETICDVTAAFLDSATGQGYLKILNEVSDLSAEVSGTVNEDETKKASATICGAKVVMAVSYVSGTALITITIEP